MSESDFWFQRYNTYNDYNEYNEHNDYKDYNDCDDYNHYNHYNHFNHYNHYKHYKDYTNYNDYRDSRLDLDLERFSDTVDYYWQIAKLQSWHVGVVIYNQIVTWTAFAIAMFA